MFKFTSVALLASAAAAFSESRSVDSVQKMRNLSSTLHSNMIDGGLAKMVSNGSSASSSVVSDLNEMINYFNDIPGAGFIISTIFPGNSDTKAIMQMLEEIQSELTDMHGEMLQAWDDIMTQANLDQCYSQLEPKEEVIYAAWEDFRIWLDALNNGSYSEAYVDQQRQYFTNNCSDNACMNSARYLLNGLKPRGAFPTLECDYLSAMYDSSGVQGYTGYADYIATKSAMMLLEATVASIMETVNLISTTTTLTPEEALQSTINRFGPWMKDSANAIIDKVADCKTNMSETVDKNTKTAIIRVFEDTSDKQERADGVHDILKLIYDTTSWVCAAADYSSQVCLFDYADYDSMYSYYEHRDGLHFYCQQISGSQKAPISSFVNQQRWGWWEDGNEGCTKLVRDEIGEAGCGGGTIVARKSQDMKYSTDRSDLWVTTDGYMKIVGWAAHDCKCNWPDGCNSIPQFLE